MFLSNGYKAQLAQQAFGVTSASEDYVIGLFTNNVTVSDATLAANLTTGNWTGYSNVSLPRSAFNNATVVSNVAILGTNTVPQFTNGSNATVNVYGFSMTGANSALLVLAQNFPTVPVPILAGQTLTLFPFQIGTESY